MSTNISEGLPAKKKAAPVVSAPKGGDKPDAKKGGTAENSGKRIRQAVYDIRYRARREDIDLKQAFSQYMSNTSMDQKDRAEVRSKLFGKGGVSEQYIGASDDWAIESFSKAFTTVFEHHQKDADGNTVPHEDEFVTEYERKLSEEKARKYKVRVTDPKSEKSYVRYADREKITALRGKGLKVEMTEYGTPYEGEKKRGEETAKALGGGKKAKKDYDGDGKVESGSKEHAGAVHNAIQRAKGGKADGKDTRKEEYLADGTTSTEPTGKKINPKNVDNYKSGAVQVAPVDEADPQNGYGVKEGVEVKKKDNRANYAYVNFMKNKMRAAFGVKNVMPMVNPDEAEEKLIGTICYGDPIGRHSGASISTAIPRTSVYELVRLYVFDGYGNNIESYLIGESFRWLKNNKKDIKALISYSDPMQGHVGTIYQATNWIYTGLTQKNYDWRLKGTNKHSRTLNGQYNAEYMNKYPDKFEKIARSQKHRYFMILASKKLRNNLIKNLGYPKQPYPKGDNKRYDSSYKITKQLNMF